MAVEVGFLDVVPKVCRASAIFADFDLFSKSWILEKFPSPPPKTSSGRPGFPPGTVPGTPPPAPPPPTLGGCHGGPRKGPTKMWKVRGS